MPIKTGCDIVVPMTLTFISNYINHHQIPFCDACYSALGDGFRFVQTSPMEAERKNMGWNEEEVPPYVIKAYEEPELAEKLFLEADVSLAGWSGREDLVERRMAAARPTVRVSERLYREGQWKAVSPRGLIHKYKEHIRYRNSNIWLLAIGAYTASDFKLIHSYPGRIFRWGYFPRFEDYDGAAVEKERRSRETVRILWAGRFLPLKHPDYAVYAVSRLLEEGEHVSLTMVGDGECAGELRYTCEKSGIRDRVEFTGFLSPEDTRKRIKRPFPRLRERSATKSLRRRLRASRSTRRSRKTPRQHTRGFPFRRRRRNISRFPRREK